jgi:hypothetical protein
MATSVLPSADMAAAIAPMRNVSPWLR